MDVRSQLFEQRFDVWLRKEHHEIGVAQRRDQLRTGLLVEDWATSSFQFADAGVRIDRNDKGGNAVQVQFLDRRTNLHSVWDSALLGRMGTEEQLLPALSRESTAHARGYAKGSVAKWAEDGHKVAVKTVYGRLPKTAPGTPVAIDVRYEKAADPVIRRQIELAGARLAKVLNSELQ